MRVLYVIDSLTASGAEQSLASMAAPLVENGVELHVAYLVERPGLHQQLVEAGATLVPITDAAGRADRVRVLQDEVRTRRPALIHTTLFESDITGRIAGARTRTPVVSSLVNPMYGTEHRSDPGVRLGRLRAAQLLDVVTARAVTTFHAISADVGETMARRLCLPRARLRVVPRGRDPRALGSRDEARRQRVRGALGVRPGTRLVLAAARQEHQKGLDVLLDALGILERAGRASGLEVLLAGRDGNASGLLRQRAEELGLGARVRFLGARSDVPDLLCAADVFCVPSRWEGLGSVVLEAMALEAPLVASDLPAIREMLDPSCALLVPPEDPSSLAEAIGGALEEGGADGRARVARRRFDDHFSIDGVAAAMAQLYVEAIDIGPRPRWRPLRPWSRGRPERASSLRALTRS